MEELYELREQMLFSYNTNIAEIGAVEVGQFLHVAPAQH